MDDLDDTFIVMNGDVLTTLDFGDARSPPPRAAATRSRSRRTSARSRSTTACSTSDVGRSRVSRLRGEAGDRLGREHGHLRDGARGPRATSRRAATSTSRTSSRALLEDGRAGRRLPPRRPVVRHRPSRGLRARRRRMEPERTRERKRKRKRQRQRNGHALCKAERQRPQPHTRQERTSKSCPTELSAHSNPTREKKALITGGAGFIGSHLAELLLARLGGLRARRRLDRSLENVAHLRENPHFHLVVESVLSPSVVNELVHKCDVVYHLAAAVGVRLIVEQPVHTLMTNIRGTETCSSTARASASGSWSRRRRRSTATTARRSRSTRTARRIYGPTTARALGLRRLEGDRRVPRARLPRRARASTA